VVVVGGGGLGDPYIFFIFHLVEEKIEFITSLLLHSVSWLFCQSSGSFNDRQT
jgi:hypothetical protein